MAPMERRPADPFVAMGRRLAQEARMAGFDLVKFGIEIDLGSGEPTAWATFRVVEDNCDPNADEAKRLIEQAMRETAEERAREQFEALRSRLADGKDFLA